MTIIVAGEVLWDVFEDAELLGGAPLNFAVHSARLGHQALLVSAVGDDERGRRARAQIESLGVDTTFLSTSARYATGAVTVTLQDGQPEYVIHRPAAYDDVQPLSGEVTPDWIYTGTLAARSAPPLPQAKRFYDVNLRPKSWTPELVLELMAQANAIKLNGDEVRALAEAGVTTETDIEQFCRQGAECFGWEAACITHGSHGCSVLVGDLYAECPGYRVLVADAVGAGDAFAAAFLHGFNLGWSPATIGDFANRVGALVASRRGGTPAWTLAEVDRLGKS